MSLTGGSVAAAAAAATAAALSLPRAGAQPPLATALSAAAADPISLFDTLLVVLATGAVGLKAVDRFAGDGRGGASAKAVEEKDEKPAAVTSMQRKFLAAFWLLRCGYWMSGPYVVPAYRSKVFNGVEASLGLVSKIFLTGFAATAIVSACFAKKRSWTNAWCMAEGHTGYLVSSITHPTLHKTSSGPPLGKPPTSTSRRT